MMEEKHCRSSAEADECTVWLRVIFYMSHCGGRTLSEFKWGLEAEEGIFVLAHFSNVLSLLMVQCAGNEVTLMSV